MEVELLWRWRCLVGELDGVTASLRHRSPLQEAEALILRGQLVNEVICEALLRQRAGRVAYLTRHSGAALGQGLASLRRGAQLLQHFLVHLCTRVSFQINRF